MGAVCDLITERQHTTAGWVARTTPLTRRRSSDYHNDAHDQVTTTADFRRLALALDGAEEGAHMGSPDFRVGGRIFATLASASRGFGNLMLTPDAQAMFVEEAPDVFEPIAGGWGRMGATHIRLAAADEATLSGALRTAWKLRVEKNAKTSRGGKRSRKK